MPTIKHIALTFCVLITSGCSKPPTQVSFIFDDAYLSHAQIAETFKEHDYRAGFAVNGSLVKWSNGRKLTFEQLRKLQGEGHEIINHGARHLNLANENTPLKDAASEILGGLKVLEAEGLRVTTYVAANSSMADLFIDRYLRSSHKLGFTRPQSSNNDSQIARDAYRLQRVNLHQVGVDGAKQLINDAIDNGSWLVFYDHDPSQEKYPKSLKARDIAELLEFCKSRNVEVVTPTIAATRHGYIK